VEGNETGKDRGICSLKRVMGHIGVFREGGHSGLRGSAVTYTPQTSVKQICHQQTPKARY